jgi:long-chain acyl-CoA synthetase
MNAAEALPAAAAAAAARVAVRLGDETLTYRALDRGSARVAALLAQRGIGDGACVALALPNVPAFAQAYYGVLRAGAVALALPPALDPRPLRRLLREAGAALLIAWHASAERAEEAAHGTCVQCVFVVPGELPRLLARVAPAATVRPRADADPATIAAGPPRAERSHGWLRDRALETVTRERIGAADVVPCDSPLWDPVTQAGFLHAAVLAGAAVALGPLSGRTWPRSGTRTSPRSACA